MSGTFEIHLQIILLHRLPFREKKVAINPLKWVILSFHRHLIFRFTAGGHSNGKDHDVAIAYSTHLMGKMQKTGDDATEAR